jgi:hypothetical protein
MDELKNLLDTFEHHNPSSAQVERILAVRNACKVCAAAVFELVPSSSDRTAALRKLHECMMTANKAIVLEKSNG